MSTFQTTWLPAATVTTSVAGRGLTLHRKFGEEALSTGVLFKGWRTAAVLSLPLTCKAVKMSKEQSELAPPLCDVDSNERLTVGGNTLKEKCKTDDRAKLHE